MSKPSCLIVMYHYVGDYEKYPGIHAVSGFEFADQVDALSKAMEPIDWPTLYAWTQGKGSIPDRCFLLTFDDGLIKQNRVVFPILEKRGIRGTFLVPGAVLSGDVLLPAHAIHLLLSKMALHELQRVIDTLARGCDLSGAETMYHYEPSIVARFKYLLTVALPFDTRAPIVRSLFETHVGEMEEYAARWYMDVTDLRRMEDAGHTIGGQGFSHEPYGGMLYSDIAYDMHEARTVLSEALDGACARERLSCPRPFSYPYGQCPEGAPARCKTAGFSAAFTTERRWADDTCGPFRLPRVDAMYLEATNGDGFGVASETTDATLPAVSGVRED